MAKEELQRQKKALQGHQEREYYRLKETGNGIPTIEEIAKGTSKNCSERRPHERNSYGRGGKKGNKNARKEIPASRNSKVGIEPPRDPI